MWISWTWRAVEKYFVEKDKIHLSTSSVTSTVCHSLLFPSLPSTWLSPFGKHESQHDILTNTDRQYQNTRPISHSGWPAGHIIACFSSETTQQHLTENTKVKFLLSLVNRNVKALLVVATRISDSEEKHPHMLWRPCSVTAVTHLTGSDAHSLGRT